METDLVLNKAKIPIHIAIIMDGNGRWAKEKGKARVFGHKNGVTAVRECAEATAQLGVKYLTLYAFSTENWDRPKHEVNALMTLLVESIKKEVKTLNKNGIRLNAIGDLKKLPTKTYKALVKGIEDTKQNEGMTLTLALNYSSRWEISQAAKKIAIEVKAGQLDPEDINASLFSNHLQTADIPDPELLIRTSGETRISNFLLWQISYAELSFLDIFWPDFRKKHLLQSIYDFQNRERRFGKTSEQIQTL
jgi:undecaprenyl diphosphate synthase